jgi:transposase
MARPLSLDLRERVVRTVEGGSSRRAAAQQFAVSVSFVIKLMQRWHRQGTAAPAAVGGQKEHALAPHEALVRQLVDEQRDITLAELRQRLAERDIVVGRSSVDRFLQAIGLTRKKRRSMPPNRSARTSPRRARPGGRTSRA